MNDISKILIMDLVWRRAMNYDDDGLIKLENQLYFSNF